MTLPTVPYDVAAGTDFARKSNTRNILRELAIKPTPLKLQPILTLQNKGKPYILEPPSTHLLDRLARSLALTKEGHTRESCKNQAVLRQTVDEDTSDSVLQTASWTETTEPLRASAKKAHL